MGPECGASTTSSPLTEVPIQWKYPGTGMMSMGNSDPAGIKEWFIDMFLEMTDGDATDNVPMEDYLEFVIEDEGVIPYMKELFHKLLIEDRVLGDSEFVDRNLFDLVPEEVWREITVAQSYDPSNDPNNEYFHITKDDVVYLLKDATYFGAVNNDQFLEAYSKLGGSPRVARELFAKLTTDGTTVSWYDIRDKDEVFDVYGQVHDRGDEEMFTRNEEVRRISEAELTQSMVEGKSEL